MHVWYVCMYFHMCVGLKLTSDTFLDCFPFYLIEQGFALHPDLRILTTLDSELVLGIPLCWIYRQSHTCLTFMWVL